MAVVRRTADDQPERHWYSVVYKFDPDGKFLSSDHAYIGTDNEPRRVSRQILADLLARLENKTYGSIFIQQFSVQIDDVMHGLFETTDSYGLSLTMQPVGYVFDPPWNGHYST